MATVADLFVNLRLDATEYQTGMKAAQKSAQDFTSQLGQLGTRMASTPGLAEASAKMREIGFSAQATVPMMNALANATSGMGAKQQEVIRNVVTAFGEMRKSATLTMEGMQSLTTAGLPAWNLLAKSLGTDVAGAMLLVEQKAISTKQAFTLLQGSMAATAPAVGAFSAATTSIASFAGTVIGKFLPAITAIGAVVGLIHAAEEMETAFVKLGQRTGATGERLHELEVAFKNVYAQTAASADAVVTAMALIHQRTGATGDQLEKLTLKMLLLAKVANTDVATVAPLVTRMFGDWSIGAERQAAALDFLRVVVQKTGTPLQELADRVVWFGAPLRQMGFQFEQAVEILGRFGKEGVNTETVLTGMRFALGNFAKQGISDTAGAFRDIIQQIREAPSEAEKMAIAFQTFGKRAAMDMYRAIVEGRFDDFLSGEFERVKEVGTAVPITLGDAWKKLMHALEITAAPVLAGVLAILGDALNLTAQLINMLRNVPGQVWAGVKGGFLGGIGNMITGSGGPLGFALGFVPGAAAAGAAWEQQNTFKKQGPAIPANYNPKTGQWLGEKPPPSGGGENDNGYEKWENPRVFEDLSIKNALWVEQLRQEAEERKKLKKEVIDGLQHIEHEKKIKGELLALSLGFTDGISQEARAFYALEQSVLACVPAHEKLTDYVKRMDEMLPGLNQQLKTMTGAAREEQQAADALTDAERALGIRKRENLTVDQAIAAYQVILENASIESARAIEDAQLAVIKAKIDNRDATQADVEAYYKLIDRQKDALGNAISYWKEFHDAGKRAFDGLSRSIAESIVHWGGLFDSLKKIAEDLAVSMLDTLTKGLLKPFEDAFTNLIAGIGEKLGGMLTKALGGSGGDGILGKIGGLFGGGGGGGAEDLPGGILTELPGEFGDIGGAAGGVGGAAAGGVTGIVGAVGGVVSAVSGVIGNFQMHGMNKSLDLIVNHTLRTFNELFNFRRDAWDRHTGLFLKLDDMWNEIRNVVAAIRGGVGSGVVASFSDARMVEWLGNIFNRLGELPTWFANSLAGVLSAPIAVEEQPSPAPTSGSTPGGSTTPVAPALPGVSVPRIADRTSRMVASVSGGGTVAARSAGSTAPPAANVGQINIYESSNPQATARAVARELRLRHAFSY